MPAKILKTAFAAFPSVKLMYFTTDKKTKKQKFSFKKELLFGDYIKPYLTAGGEYETVKVQQSKKTVTYIKVRARNADGYVKQEDLQPNRILEVNFIDVGQGDGCHIATPDDQHFLIDAGPSDNMYRFLKWRFNLAKAKSAPPPFTVIISHSDSDHYKGFGKIFTETKGAAQQFTINKVYHNGMVEASGEGAASLGKLVTDKGQEYVTNLCDTDADYKKRVKSLSTPGVYVSTLNKTAAPKEALRFGSNPVYKKDNLIMEVSGPVAQQINGKDALPVFDKNKGKTKNGHSVILRLTIGKLKLFLGGDLNTESENYLLQHYSGADVAAIKKELKKKNLDDNTRKQLEQQLQNAIVTARGTLQVDIAKSCHHGSADFTSEFLKALNAIATIISSGDEEPHTHPRPDTLGTIGKHSRGERSLIFCTELARSSKEFVEVAKINTEAKKERVVTVYGMINVRTDGEKVIIAQKLERKAAGRSWDIHKLEWNNTTAQFEYRQFEKHE